MAGFYDVRLLDASGDYGEDDVGDGCGLLHSYLLSTSFCSGSAKKQRNKNIYNT